MAQPNISFDYPTLNRLMGRSTLVEAVAGTTTGPHLVTGDQTLELPRCCGEPPPGIFDVDSL